MILIQKYVRLPKFRCEFLQGREVRHINMLVKKYIKLSSETPKQGLVKEDDNKEDETEEVEDKDIKDQYDIDNHNVNINCKENDNDVDCNNNKTQNTIKIIVNNNYKKN